MPHSCSLRFQQGGLPLQTTSLALKLPALAVGKHRLKPPIRVCCQSLYQDLWSVYTLKEERSDREQIDTLLTDLPNREA